MKFNKKGETKKNMKGGRRKEKLNERATTVNTHSTVTNKCTILYLVMLYSTVTVNKPDMFRSLVVIIIRDF
jgi:hypothetical protein